MRGDLSLARRFTSLGYIYSLKVWAKHSARITRPVGKRNLCMRSRRNLSLSELEFLMGLSRWLSVVFDIRHFPFLVHLQKPKLFVLSVRSVRGGGLNFQRWSKCGDLGDCNGQIVSVRGNLTYYGRQ